MGMRVYCFDGHRWSKQAQRDEVNASQSRSVYLPRQGTSQQFQLWIQDVLRGFIGRAMKMAEPTLCDFGCRKDETRSLVLSLTIMVNIVFLLCNLLAMKCRHPRCSS
jgi:hypothetical protein